jgi:hypothetical protein
MVRQAWAGSNVSQRTTGNCDRAVCRCEGTHVHRADASPGSFHPKAERGSFLLREVHFCCDGEIYQS